MRDPDTFGNRRRDLSSSPPTARPRAARRSGRWSTPKQAQLVEPRSSRCFASPRRISLARGGHARGE